MNPVVLEHLTLIRASEGKTVEVPYRGDVNKTILDVLGGIRSGPGESWIIENTNFFFRVQAKYPAQVGVLLHGCR